jgi:hypothetical protein
MSDFRIVTKRAVVDTDIHLQLFVRRGEHWSIGGVLHLYRHEWNQLAALLADRIEILPYEPRETIPAE